MNYRPMSFCPHELPPRPKKSIKLPSLHTLPPFRQSNTCKDLNVLTQFQKLPKYPYLKKEKGVITFSPHELPASVILPPRTTPSTKIEHPTTNLTPFAPFRQLDPLCPTVNCSRACQVPSTPFLFRKCPPVRLKARIPFLAWNTLNALEFCFILP
jgi:hypothetical protein